MAKLISRKAITRPGKGPLSTVIPRSSLLVPKARGRAKNPASITNALIAEVQHYYPSVRHRRYHNWTVHVRPMVEMARVACKRLRAAGVTVNETALVHGVILHDALVHVNPRFYGFASEEQHAGHVAYNILRGTLNAPESHARVVERIVHSSHFMVAPRTVEEIMMRALDVGNIGGKYGEFSKNWERLLDEARVSARKTGQILSQKEFALRTLGFLPFFFRFYFELTPKARVLRNGKREKWVSVWHEKGLRNLTSKFSQVFGGRQNIRLIAQVGSGKNPITLSRQFRENELFVGIEPDSSARETALALSNQYRKDRGIRSPAFFVPGTGKAIPLGGYDEIHYRNVNHERVLDIAEAKRAIRKPGGRVIVEETFPATGFRAKRPTAEQVIEGFSRHNLVPEKMSSGRQGIYRIVFKAAR